MDLEKMTLRQISRTIIPQHLISSGWFNINVLYVSCLCHLFMAKAIHSVAINETI